MERERPARAAKAPPLEPPAALAGLTTARRRPRAPAGARDDATTSASVRRRERGAFTSAGSGSGMGEPRPVLKRRDDTIPGIGDLAPPNASFKRARAVGRSATLDDVAERIVLAFLPIVPDRLRAEAVCTRWRRLSLREVPVEAIDCEAAGHKRVPKQQDLARLLQRADGRLQHLALPNVAISDAHMQLISAQSDLRSFRAYRLQKKHLFELLGSSNKLEKLEILDCAQLSLTGWKSEFGSALQEIALHQCRNPAIGNGVLSVTKACGATLKKLAITGGVHRHLLGHLVQHVSSLDMLTLNCCDHIDTLSFNAFANATASTLRWLDLSLCDGLRFKSLSTLPSLSLEVLLLDKTYIDDRGLETIACASPHLKYLSLQDCRSISDAGVNAVSVSCIHLELIDLKGTRVSDESLLTLKESCSSLRMVRVDSCRSVSRDLRQRFDNTIREISQRDNLNEREQMFMGRQRVEPVRLGNSDSESTEESSEEETFSE